MGIHVNKAGGSAVVSFAQPQEVVITHTDDSIKVGDGVDFLAINADGSINVSGISTVSGTVGIDGLDSFKTTQYTVGTSAVQLTVTPLTNRSSMSIKAACTSNTEIIYIGTTSGVTTSTGYPLNNGDTLQLDVKGTQTVYAIGTAAGQKVYTLELG